MISCRNSARASCSVSLSDSGGGARVRICSHSDGRATDCRSFGNRQIGPSCSVVSETFLHLLMEKNIDDRKTFVKQVSSY